ncbi:MAG: M28 family peptidase, partial [Acidimicrobiales bacterium]
MDQRQRFEQWFGGLAAIGRAAGGGWQRFAWTREDRQARRWFTDLAHDVGLDVELDGNGNLWAWWGEPGPDSIVTGSHLDTVANGGAYDGALGVVSGLLAVDDLCRTRGSAPPPRSLAVAAFADEEGGRFNLPCFGSKLLTGALEPAAVLDRRDADGVSVAEAMADFDAGADPSGIGPDRERLGRIGAFVELHVEQGRGLADLGVG